MANDLENMIAAFQSGKQTPQQVQQVGKLLELAAAALQAPKKVQVNFTQIARERRERVEARFGGALAKLQESKLTDALNAGGWVLSASASADGSKHYTRNDKPKQVLQVGTKVFTVLNDGVKEVDALSNEHLVFWLDKQAKTPKTQSNMM